MLTVDQLKEMRPGQVIKSGLITNNPEGVYLTDTNYGEVLRWIAVRGKGYHDWAIYCYWNNEGWTDEHILRNGQKVGNSENVKKLVPCDDEALELYRI